jgi:hypothetical protein
MTAYIGSTEVVLLHIRDIPQSLAQSECKVPAIRESPISTASRDLDCDSNSVVTYSAGWLSGRQCEPYKLEGLRSATS